MSAAFRDRFDRAFATPVETERLQIGPWLPGEEARFADFLNADGRNFPRWAHHYLYSTAEKIDEQIVRSTVFPALRQEYESKDVGELYIRKKTDGRFVGFVEFTMDRLGRDRVSYYILPSERGGGYAREAYAACINHAVTSGALSGSLYAHTAPENTVSQNFLRSAGFESKGQVVAKNAQNEDIQVVAFTRPLSENNPIVVMPALQPFG